MALKIVIQPVDAGFEVPEDVAADLLEVYTALKGLPSGNQATVDFDELPTPEENVKAAKTFVKQAKSWAANQEPALRFIRKGDITGMPTRVSFQILDPVPEVNEDGTPRAKRGRKPKTEDDAAA